MAAIIKLIQKIIRVPNTEIGTLLLMSSSGAKKEDIEEAERELKEYNAGFKFRRYKIEFAWKIVYWNFSALLFFVIFWRKFDDENPFFRKTMILP